VHPKTYEAKIVRRNLFKSIEPRLWGYIVNVPIKVIREIGGLDPLPYVSNVLWLPKLHPTFDEIYCEDTGFTREFEHKAIFL